jgi:hypothetical protein
MSEFNIEVQGGTAVKLPTAGKYCEKDIVVTAIGGGLEEIEQMIDESGVLDNTEGTATEKVEQVLDMGEFAKHITNSFSMEGNHQIERVEFFLGNEFVSLVNAFRNCVNLKYMKGINTSKCINVQRMFLGSGIEVIDEPLDFSSVTNSQFFICFFGCYNLREIRIVPETLKVSTNTFGGQHLSAASIQSIAYGLAYVTTTQTLTLSQVFENDFVRLPAELRDLINAKGWTLVFE